MKLFRANLLFFVLFCAQYLAAQPAWVRDSLDIYIKNAMKAEEVPGLAFAVIKDGKVVLQRTYGVREMDKKTPVDENTLFMIGSNTKAYTATLISILNSEKKLSFSDRVTKWLPGFRLYDPCATEKVTLRDLLCHRIGMRTFQGDFTFWSSTLTREEVMDKMSLLPPSYDFRTQFGYCNSAFLTAGQVIPAVTGQQWEYMLTERIFKPLKMDRAVALSAELSEVRNAARPHAHYDGKLQKLEYPLIDNLAPAGSISLSISDMSHWLIMQMDTGRYEGRQVIPKEAILETWNANTIVSPRTGYAYGMGWFISYPEGKKMLDHTGGVDGFLSASAFLPELRLGVIVLTNTDNNALFASIRDQLLQVYKNQPSENAIAAGTAGWLEGEKEEAKRIADLREEVAKSKSMAAPNLEKYAGTYSNPIYDNVKVVLENGQLHLYLGHHPNSTGVLEYRGDNKFLCTFANPTLGIQPLDFTMAPGGQVKSMTLKVNDFVEYGAYEFIPK